MHLLKRKSYSDKKWREGISKRLKFRFFRVTLDESALKLIKNFNFFIRGQSMSFSSWAQRIIWNTCDPWEKHIAPS